MGWPISDHFPSVGCSRAMWESRSRPEECPGPRQSSGVPCCWVRAVGCRGLYWSRG